MGKITRMSRKDSVAFLKQLMQHKQQLRVKKDLQPGKLIFCGYDAKHKEFVWDKKPMFLVLSTSKGRTLGLNFHWLPSTYRVWLITHIIRQNKKRKNPNLMAFTYGELKPLLRKLNYAPCIRCYINRRYTRTGVVIPPEHFMEAARMDTAVFSGLSAEYIYKTIVKKSKTRKYYNFRNP